MKDPNQNRTVNERGLFNYLSFLTVPAPDTLFKGIKKLEAGSWLCISNEGDIKKSKYWDSINNSKSIRYSNENEIYERILKALEDSIYYRGISDVPVGVFSIWGY